jgi:hypothetical protein
MKYTGINIFWENLTHYWGILGIFGEILGDLQPNSFCGFFD